MKRLLTISAPLCAALTLGWGASAPAQMVYTGAGPAPPGGYSFGKQEPLMSINNSYLGYSNFTYYGPHAPAAYAIPPQVHAPRYVAAPTPAPRYVAAPAPAASPRRVFWYQGRWYYQN